jgi:hypothetical protein
MKQTSARRYGRAGAVVSLASASLFMFGGLALGATNIVAESGSAIHTLVGTVTSSATLVTPDDISWT